MDPETPEDIFLARLVISCLPNNLDNSRIESVESVAVLSPASLAACSADLEIVSAGTNFLPLPLTIPLAITDAFAIAPEALATSEDPPVAANIAQRTGSKNISIPKPAKLVKSSLSLLFPSLKISLTICFPDVISLFWPDKPSMNPLAISPAVALPLFGFLELYSLIASIDMPFFWSSVNSSNLRLSVPAWTAPINDLPGRPNNSNASINHFWFSGRLSALSTKLRPSATSLGS